MAERRSGGGLADVLARRLADVSALAMRPGWRRNRLAIFVAEIDGDSGSRPARRRVIDALARELGRSAAVAPAPIAPAFADPADGARLSPASLTQAQMLLTERNGDLLVAGRLRASGADRAIELCFVAPEGAGGQAGPGGECLPHEPLAPELAAALAARTAAFALAAAGERGAAIWQRLEPLARRLAGMIAQQGPALAPDARARLCVGTAQLLHVIAEHSADSGHLAEAVAAYRAALPDQPRERVPLDWARTQIGLGNALLALGERGGEAAAAAARLAEAVAAYRAALADLTRDGHPLDWAMAQNNLGVALVAIGGRELAAEQAGERLAEAVAAHRASLEAWTRSRAPLDWAAAQNNLGAALQALGEREPDAGAAAARLAEAVAAYRAALTERTRDRLPFEWAATQNNLGNALATLAQREPGGGEATARLEAAVAAYGAALSAWTRERAPLAWAATQNNLGNALAALGQRESDPARLEAAVAAYGAALVERTRDRVPLDWAATQNSLGNALLALGESEGETARLEAAAAAYRAALAERTADRAPLEWAATQNNLGAALQALGEREPGADQATLRLADAVAAYRAALSVFTRDRAPLDWATVQGNLADVLLRLGERDSTGTARLAEAEAAYRALLAAGMRAGAPLAWASAQNGLGAALLRLGERDVETALLEESVASFRAALEERTRERAPRAWAATQGNLGNALLALGERGGGAALLAEAVAAYRAALAVQDRARVPLDWAATQHNLAAALLALAARECGTARLEEAVAALSACLDITETVWPATRVQDARDRRAAALAELARRRGDDAARCAESGARRE